MTSGQIPARRHDELRWVGGLVERESAVLWFESSQREPLARADLHQRSPEDWRDLAVETALAALDSARADGAELPTTLAVPDAALRDRLAARAKALGVSVVACDDFELEELADELRAEDDDEGLGPEGGSEALDDAALLASLPDAVVASFYRAAARLYRSEPWSRLPPSLLRLSAPSIGLEELAVLALGDDEETYEALIFESPRDLDVYVNATAGAAPDSDVVPTVPVRSFTYGNGESLSAAHRALVEARGWEVASETAHPSLVHLAADGELRPIDARDLALATLANDCLAQLPARLAESAGPRGAKLEVTGASRSIEVTVRSKPIRSAEEDRRRYDPARGPASTEEWLASAEVERLRWIDATHQVDDRAHAMVHMIAENAIAADERPLFRETLARLLGEGLQRHDAIHAIGVTMTEHIYDVMESKRPYRASDLEGALGELTARSWRAFVESLRDDEDEPKPRKRRRGSRRRRGRRGKRGRRT